jgi:hypothetical protein
MKNELHSRKTFRRLIILLLIASFPLIMSAQSSEVEGRDQEIAFGIHFDPLISWFGSDFKGTVNNGARPGFNFGLTFNKYFSRNYSFSTGINIISAGGRLTSKDTTVLRFNNFTSTVLPGKPMVYKIQYLSVPVGLKLQTNQIGYMTIFTDLGFDPAVVIGGKADIPSIGIKNENAAKELRLFDLGYHISAGVEYSLGGSTAFVAGLSFTNNFLDITSETGKQPLDKVTHKMLGFRLGLNF